VSPRLLALLLVIAAIALRLLVAVPAQREAAALGDAYRRARDDRRDVAQQLAGAERREARRQKTLASMLAAAPGNADPVTRLRRDAVASVREAGVSGVRLVVVPARAPVGATLQLSARGSLVDAQRLSADLTMKRGLVLARVRFAPRDTDVTIDIDGARLLGGS